MSEILNNTFFLIFLCSFSGILIKYSLQFIEQNWITTFQHSLVYLLLPAVTFVITRVISGNIALSLGMIGALSIVRFRNPVKNPLELVFYFALVTIGISYAVNFKYGCGLTIFVSLISISYFYFIKLFSFLKLIKTPSLNHDDGNLFHTVEIETIKSLDLTENNFLINSINNFSENTHYYKFKAKNKKDISQLVNDINEKYKSSIKNINISYYS